VFWNGTRRNEAGSRLAAKAADKKPEKKSYNFLGRGLRQGLGWRRKLHEKWGKNVEKMERARSRQGAGFGRKLHILWRPKKRANASGELVARSFFFMSLYISFF
jgi:hypothetical protein